MVQAYNFKASWQLFPEKSTYETGDRPKSGIYKIESKDNTKELFIYHNWVSLENLAYSADYSIIADGEIHPFPNNAVAEQVQASFKDGITFEINFYRGGESVLHVMHEIMPNGYLKVVQHGFTAERNPYSNSEVYHKQMSVLPYSASVAGALIKPTEEGVIRHKALTAMEEQTNLQLNQIRRQIELLALQAQEIQKRKDLSLIIYSAKLNFVPVIGQIYHLYRKKDDTYIISLVSPKEWGSPAGPFKEFVSTVKLLADHTWMEL